MQRNYATPENLQFNSLPIEQIDPVLVFEKIEYFEQQFASDPEKYHAFCRQFPEKEQREITDKLFSNPEFLRILIVFVEDLKLFCNLFPAAKERALRTIFADSQHLEYFFHRIRPFPKHNTKMWWDQNSLAKGVYALIDFREYFPDYTKELLETILAQPPLLCKMLYFMPYIEQFCLTFSEYKNRALDILIVQDAFHQMCITSPSVLKDFCKLYPEYKERILSRVLSNNLAMVLKDRESFVTYFPEYVNKVISLPDSQHTLGEISETDGRNFSAFCQKFPEFTNMATEMNFRIPGLFGKIAQDGGTDTLQKLFTFITSLRYRQDTPHEETKDKEDVELPTNVKTTQHFIDFLEATADEKKICYLRSLGNRFTAFIDGELMKSIVIKIIPIEAHAEFNKLYNEKMNTLKKQQAIQNFKLLPPRKNINNADSTLPCQLGMKRYE